MGSHKFSAYLFARLAIGMSFLGHGIVRLPKVAEFAGGMVNNFQSTPLPDGMVRYFGVVLPYFELVLGALLILGLLTRIALYAGSVLMIVLIFGSCLVENWSGVGTQLFYSLYFTVLIGFYEYNRYSVDFRIGRG
ncbi:MAG: DoxX family membrane protein [Cyclobacteriaceae bacterium]